jgi:hypothetical protein
MCNSLTTSLILSTLVWLLCHLTARADLVLNFSLDDGSTFTNTVTTGLSDSVQVSVFLSQSDPETRLTDIGLQNFGTKATFSPGFVEISNPVVSNPFVPVFASIDNATGNLELAGLTFSPVQSANVKLGEFTLLTSSAGTTVLDFGDFDPSASASNFTLGNDADLDPGLFSSSGQGSDRSRSYRFTVTSVPEPSSMLLVSVGGAALIFRRRKLRV